MSGLEIPGFLIGVAGLFSSCVDAFTYFKLAQHANREIEVVLLKLDIEKTRLLIWGDNVGIYSVRHQDSRLLDDRNSKLIRRILSQIENLLTDSEKLRALYGVRTLDTPVNRVVDYISSKSLAVFRTSASRFWTRNASRVAAETLETRFARTKWAIYERGKFQSLINDLSHFVDRLFELSGVALEVQDRVIIEDIESILDISHLNIIEEATEDSYRVYSQAAASTKALTEAGTVDRRTVEEHLREVEGADLGQTRQTPNTNNLDLLWLELKRTSFFVVLTSKCRKMQTLDPCDVQLLGSQVAVPSAHGAPPWNISSMNENGGRTLGQQINRLIGVRSKIKDEEDTIGELLKQPYENTEVREAYIEGRLPVINLFIYCSPCVALIHTAFSICKKVSSPFVKVHLRPDDRLVSACCATADRTLGLRSISEWVQNWEAIASPSQSQPLASYLDSLWLDRRLQHLDYEQPYNYEEANVHGITASVLIIGEADYLAPLVQKASGLIPNATEIWHMNPYLLSRTFSGRFVESRFVSGQKAPQAQIPPVSSHFQSDASVARSASSPESAHNKRLRYEAKSTAESTGEEREDEDMQSYNHSSQRSD